MGVIKTVNNGYGNNPTMNQTFRIELDLPVLADNIPLLSCYVEDLFLRIFKERLGTFEINIKKSIHETRKNFIDIDQKLNALIKRRKNLYIIDINIK